MKTWKGYNILDLIFILTGVLSVFVTSIVFHSSFLTLIHSVFCLLMVFTQAKGKLITQIFGIITFAIYIYLSYTQRLYGESIVYLFVLMPMYIYGIVHWLRNKDKQNNVVMVKRNLSKAEWFIMIISSSIISILIFFLLKALNTNQLIISFLSFLTMLPAVYLLARRSKWNQVAFLINDIFITILWFVLVFQGNLNFISMVICFVFQSLYDIYGVLEWTKLEKQQKN